MANVVLIIRNSDLLKSMDKILANFKPQKNHIN